MPVQKSRKVFLTIVIAQFCGTALWFAGNAALVQWQQLYQWPIATIGYIAGSVQLGFIVGTLVFAFLAIADRFSPSRIFFVSCLAGSGCNLLVLADESSYTLMIISRCLTGVCLAGIYPVGMKIASDWREKGLGHWLGALVGALVLGTAFPYGLKLMPQFAQATEMLIGISVLTAAGGITMVAVVSDGPFRRPGMQFSLATALEVFRVPSFRKAAFGYFGHMWELYAFWTFVPWIIAHYRSFHTTELISDTTFAFITVAAGAAGCWLGGKLSLKVGSERVAFYALFVSCICCILSPWCWVLPPWIFTTYMICWGFTVVADSPQFSTVVAREAPDHMRGSSLTLVTCIGFSITIASIQLLNYLQHVMDDYLLLVLAAGPLCGLIAMKKRN